MSAYVPTGRPTGPVPRPPIERLLAKIEIDPVAGCWLWTGGTTSDGYGVIGVGSLSDGTRGKLLVHRLAFEFWNGPIPAGLEIDHVCRITRCCNPDSRHLEAVTNAENTRRGRAATRRIVCARGHQIVGANARRRSKDLFECRICRNARERRRS